MMEEGQWQWQGQGQGQGQVHEKGQAKTKAKVVHLPNRAPGLHVDGQFCLAARVTDNDDGHGVMACGLKHPHAYMLGPFATLTSMAIAYDATLLLSQMPLRANFLPLARCFMFLLRRHRFGFVSEHDNHEVEERWHPHFYALYSGLLAAAKAAAIIDHHHDSSHDHDAAASPFFCHVLPPHVQDMHHVLKQAMEAYRRHTWPDGVWEPFLHAVRLERRGQQLGRATPALASVPGWCIRVADPRLSTCPYRPQWAPQRTFFGRRVAFAVADWLAKVQHLGAAVGVVESLLYQLLINNNVVCSSSHRVACYCGHVVDAVALALQEGGHNDHVPIDKIKLPIAHYSPLQFADGVKDTPYQDSLLRVAQTLGELYNQGLWPGLLFLAENSSYVAGDEPYVVHEDDERENQIINIVPVDTSNQARGCFATHPQLCGGPHNQSMKVRLKLKWRCHHGGSSSSLCREQVIGPFMAAPGVSAEQVHSTIKQIFASAATANTGMGSSHHHC